MGACASTARRALDAAADLLLGARLRRLRPAGPAAVRGLPRRRCRAAATRPGRPRRPAGPGAVVRGRGVRRAWSATWSSASRSTGCSRLRAPLGGLLADAVLAAVAAGPAERAAGAGAGAVAAGQHAGPRARADPRGHRAGRAACCGPAGADVAVRAAAALASRGRRPGRARRRGPRGQPGRVDVLPRARPAAPRPAPSAGPRGRALRRRAHDRRDRPRGAARAGGRGARRWRRWRPSPRRAGGCRTGRGAEGRIVRARASVAAGRPTSVGSWSPSGSVVASSRRPAPAGRPGGKPMPVAGETVHVRLPGGAAAPGPSRSRCGLDVSPASSPPSDTAYVGRRAVVAEKLRTPLQAIVGSKTRSAGRAPSSPGSVHVPGSADPGRGLPRWRSHSGGARGNQLFNGRFTWKFRSQVDTASCRIAIGATSRRSWPSSRSTTTASSGCRWRWSASATRARATAPCGSSSPPSRRARWCGPRRVPPTRWRPSTSRWTRWPRRCARPPTVAASTTAGTPRCRWARRSPTRPRRRRARRPTTTW